jgi:PadR family transcriptional regulator AphA
MIWRGAMTFGVTPVRQRSEPMSLRYAILGFLSSTPATGYELGREFQQGAGSFWSALPSQIYPELAALEQLGWINGKVASKDRLRRRTFRLTRRGEQALTKWVEADHDYPPERDSERLRLIFLDGSSTEIIRRHFDAHRIYHAERLAVWHTLRRSVVQRTHRQLVQRLKKRNLADHELIVGLKLLALEGNVRRAEWEIAWADEALAWLATLEQGKKRKRMRPAS